MKNNLRKIGRDYEKAAGEYLEKKGYEILEYNFRCRCSEIDIIAKKDSVYIFCEVKYRASRAAGSPLEAVNLQKQRRISKAALYYMMIHGLADVPCRFDVIAVEGGQMLHIINAFEYIGD